MPHAAKIIADSVSPDGVPLTTFEITFPRIILAEFNTHRMFSRNSASSRAIPIQKMIASVLEDPYVPSTWGQNQKGMQAGDELSKYDSDMARAAWLYARDLAVDQAAKLLKLGVHKQLTNRLLEPFMWHTCIVSATEWSNFFHLRDNPMAHPDIQILAHAMQELYKNRTPRELRYGQWHMPYVKQEEIDAAILDAPPLNEVESYYESAVVRLTKVSVGRCARVSYLTHEGQRDLQADVDLHDRLLESGHMSPFEHVARPVNKDDSDLQYGPLAQQHPLLGTTDLWFGNFRGWVSTRKLIANEQDILGAR